MKNVKTISVLLSLSFLFCTAAISQNWWKSGIRGEGANVSHTLDVKNFDGIGLYFSGTVYLKQGSTYSVKVEGQQNIIDNIETEVEGDYWKIKFDRPVRKHEGVKIWITMPTLTKAHISGSGNLIGESSFTGLEEVSVGISGSGDIDLELEAKAIESKISGSGNIELGGSSGSFSIKISGSGDVKAYDLNTGSCNVRISGSGDCQVDVSEQLEVSISGSGDVYYKGRPKVKAKVSGSGDVAARS